MTPSPQEERDPDPTNEKEAFSALPTFEWVTCGVFHKEPGDWGLSGELGLAQASK